MGSDASGDPFYTGLEPTRPEGRKTAAIAISVIALVALVALLALSLAGVFRIGRPTASSVATARRVDPKGKPVRKVSRFSSSDTRIYCTARVRAFDDTVVETRWLKDRQLVKSFARTFSSMTGVPAGRLLASAANVAVYIEIPPGGWDPGRYTVEVRLDGRVAGSASFSVAGETGEDESQGFSTYTESGGAFTVSYPSGWIEADPGSLGDAAAGFISPVYGEYPARFAVMKTEYTSAEPEYLNGLIPQSGSSSQETFTAYSLGEARGARRTYFWSTKSGGETLQLKSIQVVMPGENGVYALNCHGLSSEFDDDLAAFNAIINSFRVK